MGSGLGVWAVGFFGVAGFRVACGSKIRREDLWDIQKPEPTP